MRRALRPVAVATLLCGVLAMLCASGLRTAPDRSDAFWPMLWTLPWAAIALVAQRRVPAALPLGWVLLAALLIRLPFVGTPWLLSDDAWRYLWEGQVLASGGNPFVTSPSELAGLNDALRSHVNHPDIPSVYPPLALVWFQGLHHLGGHPWIAQATALGCDLVTVALLHRHATGRARIAWLYALLPLAAIESAGNAHLEPLALAALAACFASWKARPGLSHAWAIAAAGLKVLPIVLLPLWVRRMGLGRAALQTGAGLALLVVLTGPIWSGGAEALAGWSAYSQHWSFNGLLFPWLEPLLGPLARPALVLIAAAVCLERLRHAETPWAFAAVVGTVFVCTSPTVHPWYVLWAVVPSLWCGRIAWAAASTPLLLSYGALLGLDSETGSWDVHPSLWWLTWGGAAAAAFLARRWAQTAPTPTKV